MRDVSKADKLQQLAKQHNNVRVVKLSAESDEDHAALRKQVEAEAGRVDVLIPNAALAIYEKTGEISIDNMRSQFEVNVIGPLRLFQSLLPLLAHSSNPRFVQLTSVVSSLTIQPTIATFPVAAYAGSKAALNMLVRRIHLEHNNLTAFLVHPGREASKPLTPLTPARLIASIHTTQQIITAATHLVYAAHVLCAQVGCNRMLVTTVRISMAWRRRPLPSRTAAVTCCSSCSMQSVTRMAANSGMRTMAKSCRGSATGERNEAQWAETDNEVV